MALFPFDKMVPGMLDPEMIEDTAKIVNEALKDKFQVSLINNNHAGGNAPLIAEKIAERLHNKQGAGRIRRRPTLCTLNIWG
jgi:hypothetical protein